MEEGKGKEWRRWRRAGSGEVPEYFEEVSLSSEYMPSHSEREKQRETERDRDRDGNGRSEPRKAEDAL